MVIIKVFDASGKVEQHSSDKESLMIGKAPGNDICIDVEGVSRYHARLSIDGASVVIEDLGSKNGTYVNAERIERVTLSPGDRIAVGTAGLAVELVPGEGSADTPSGATGNWSALAAANVLTETPPIPAAMVEAPSIAPAEPPRQTNEEFYWQSLSSFLGPVWKYVTDDGISEIMVNGPDEIYIESKGHLERVPERFTNNELQAAVLNIAQYVGRRVSEEEPYLDARLPDGSRVAVLMPPCSRKGTSISIRKFSKEKLTLDKLIKFGSLTPEMATFLRAAVMLKKNIIVSGGTSSGKTSLLNCVSSLIPDNERILTIEDSAELQLTQDHVLPMETRPPDKKGRGQVTIRDLVRASLRMRPDRIVVGEIRGGEALDLLQAMNTGHSGSMATVHASSPRQSLTRLETLSLFSGLEIPMRALREQVASALDIVIQAARLSDHSRKVTHISEVADLREDGTYEVHDIFKFVRTGSGPEGKIIGSHVWTGYKPSCLEEMELSGLTEAVALFQGEPQKQAI